MVFRKTRHGDIDGELTPPYEVTLLLARFGSGANIPDLVHATSRVGSGRSYNTCCRIRELDTFKRYNTDLVAPTCLHCAKCRGCYCCKPGHIRNETMFMGKWETKDGRQLYPFEMDATHLMNSIAKLKRDKHHFKNNWVGWVEALEAEARLRCLL